jgi:hypothetical protein
LPGPTAGVAPPATGRPTGEPAGPVTTRRGEGLYSGVLRFKASASSARDDGR